MTKNRENIDAELESLRLKLANAERRAERAEAAVRVAFCAGFNAHPDKKRTGWTFTASIASDHEPSAWAAWLEEVKRVAKVASRHGGTDADDGA